MRSTVTMKIRSKKSIRVIIIRFLKVFGGFLKMSKKRQKTHYNHSDEFFVPNFHGDSWPHQKQRFFLFTKVEKKLNRALKTGGPMHRSLI